MLPTFETERLFIRGVRLEDAESYERNFANYEVVKQLSSIVPWPYPKGGVADFLQSQVFPHQGTTYWFWVLFFKDKRDEVIGSLDLRRDEKLGNRGFWLAEPYWRRGLMTEAVVPTTDYAFERLGFERLVFSNAVGNDGSTRIKEKTGATYLGNKPAKFVSSEYTEAEWWELTKEAWRRFRSSHNTIQYKISF